jgi:hypothetical protein
VLLIISVIFLSHIILHILQASLNYVNRALTKSSRVLLSRPHDQVLFYLVYLRYLQLSGDLFHFDNDLINLALSSSVDAFADLNLDDVLSGGKFGKQ